MSDYWIWLVAIFDIAAMGFFLTMAVSAKARNAFCDWLDRNEDAVRASNKDRCRPIPIERLLTDDDFELIVEERDEDVADVLLAEKRTSQMVTKEVQMGTRYAMRIPMPDPRPLDIDLIVSSELVSAEIGLHSRNGAGPIISYLEELKKTIEHAIAGAKADA